MTILAEGFEPSENDVICGRGKKCFSHEGNERFRKRVIAKLDEYSNAKTKVEKSGVLSDVVDEVRKASPGGGFVKQDESGRWYEVGDFLAREKTSQSFRDALHERYKSSNVAKKKRRQQEQAKAAEKWKKPPPTQFEIASQLQLLRARAVTKEIERNCRRFPDTDSISPDQTGSSFADAFLDRLKVPQCLPYCHGDEPRSPRRRRRSGRYPPAVSPPAVRRGNILRTRSFSPKLSVDKSNRARSKSFNCSKDFLYSLPEMHLSPDQQRDRRTDNREKEFHNPLKNPNFINKRAVVFEPNEAIHFSPEKAVRPRLNWVASDMHLEPIQSEEPIKTDEKLFGDRSTISSPALLIDKCAEVYEDSTTMQESSKDYVSCLEKFTESTIADENPFEPIPYATDSMGVTSMDEEE